MFVYISFMRCLNHVTVNFLNIVTTMDLGHCIRICVCLNGYILLTTRIKNDIKFEKKLYT